MWGLVVKRHPLIDTSTLQRLQELFDTPEGCADLENPSALQQVSHLIKALIS